MKNLLKAQKSVSFLTSLFLAITLFTAFPVRGYAAENEKTFDIIEVTDFHGTLKDSSGNPVAGVLADRIGNVKKSNSDRTLILGGRRFISRFCSIQHYERGSSSKSYVTNWHGNNNPWKS